MHRDEDVCKVHAKKFETLDFPIVATQFEWSNPFPV